jgi:hypothetical protein
VTWCPSRLSSPRAARGVGKRVAALAYDVEALGYGLLRASLVKQEDASGYPPASANVLHARVGPRSARRAVRQVQHRACFERPALTTEDKGNEPESRSGAPP